MNFRRRRFAWLAILAGVGVGALTGWWLLRAPTRQTHRLPDGSELELRLVTYDRSYRIATGNRFRDRLGPLLPASWANSWGCWLVEAGRTNELSFWLLQRQPAPSGPRSATATRMRAVTLDAHGCEIGLVDVLPRPTADPTETLFVADFAVFPRREQTVGLRVYQPLTPETWTAVAEFSVRNPDRRSYPTWTSQPFPVTQSVDGLQCALLELKAGVRQNTYPPVPSGVGEPLGTYLKLRLTERDGPTPAWKVSGVQAMSDAMGHTISAGHAQVDTPAGNCVLVGGGGLCVRELAWKINVEVARTTNFPAANLWAVSNVLLPDDQSASQLDATTNLHGVQLRLKGIIGKSCAIPGSSSGASRMLNGSGLVHVTLANLKPNQRFELVRVTDSEGREMTRGGRGVQTFGDQNRTDYFFGVTSSQQLPAPRVNLLFTVSEAIELEFLAAPSRINPDQIADLER